MVDQKPATGALSGKNTKYINIMENKMWYQKAISGRSLLAGILIVGGLLCGLYFLAIFDTSVEVPEDVVMGQLIPAYRVNNIGLMQDRQNGIYLGFGAAVVGLGIKFLGDRNKKDKS